MNLKHIYKSAVLFFLLVSILFSCGQQKTDYKNSWAVAPSKTPNNASVDAPLMGNGDITMCVGYKESCLRYYLSKNDFWRLVSQGDGLSGPRSLGFIDLTISGFEEATFTAEQFLENGITSCVLQKDDIKVESKSWVSARDNLIFLEVKAIGKAVKVSFDLASTVNGKSLTKAGKQENCYWQTRAFVDSVDIETEVAVALKSFNYEGNEIELQAGKKLMIAVAIESKFKSEEPLKYVLNKLGEIDKNDIEKQLIQHRKWWKSYWEKSSIQLNDSILMKAYYQGLYTMAACSRDPEFPPGIFAWTTNDKPAWNGDYHLNYNFQAPFYALHAANRLEQAQSHDAPLLDFIPRGKWYAQKVTNTRGILYPVGIGPIGIEVTRNFPRHEKEFGGLFFGQRSNAAYGLLNMAQQWRCTYDLEYGQKIYPYVLEVADFWEDYLKFENGRYVVYGDAIHEGSGKDKNPILSLGLIRNSFDLIIDLSMNLKRDEDRLDKWTHILNNLSDYPIQIRNGRTVFRYTEEGLAWYDGNGLGIQHIYPSNAITLDSNKELLSIANNTIDEMQRWQDFNTSSSFFMAAIRVGYDSRIILDELRKYALHTYPNGFQLNNPHGIENSCTVANALMEMMCMSAGNVIRLFPLWPKNEDASFTNIRAWGAFLVSAKLKNGVVADVKIISEKGKPLSIVNPWPGMSVSVFRNSKKSESIKGDRLTLETAPDEIIELIHE